MAFSDEFRDSKKTRNPQTTDRRTDRPSYRDAWTHLKTGRNATQTITFFFVDALSGLILCYPVIQTIFNTIFFVFVLNNVKFTIKKDPHGVKWPSNNTTKDVPRVAVDRNQFKVNQIFFGNHM